MHTGDTILRVVTKLREHRRIIRAQKDLATQRTTLMSCGALRLLRSASNVTSVRARALETL